MLYSVNFSGGNPLVGLAEEASFLEQLKVIFPYILLLSIILSIVTDFDDFKYFIGLIIYYGDSITEERKKKGKI